MTAASFLTQLLRKWELQRRTTWFLFVTAIALVLAALLKITIGIGWIILMAILILGAAIASWFASKDQLKAADIVSRLDAGYPELEESAGLLLAAAEPKSLLQKLQTQKVAGAIERIRVASPFLKKLYWSALACLAATSLFLVLPEGSNKQIGGTVKSNVSTAREGTGVSTPAGISSVNLKINSPAYMKMPVKEQKSLVIQAEQGSVISWQLGTNLPVTRMRILFNDSTVLNLTAADSGKKFWTANKTVIKPGFYRIETAGKLSPFYTIEVKPDLAPVLAIVTPEGQTNIEPGMPLRTTIRAILKDDHGLQQASLQATIASGSGESVKFREEKIDITSLVKGQREISWNRVLDLAAMGLKGGDELYFFLQAKDGLNQESRSDICIVRLPDTSALMSLDGLLTAMDIKPEFFRSQRQIIIETEQLIKDKPNISVETFNAKSNYLGGEQKLLRLRYGKFLGEEDETKIGPHEHDEAGEENDLADFGNAAKVLDEVSHKHDVSEDATFLDADTKRQLKATLTEMWSAELKLRLYSPEKALPFEYKALRLLKELQQQSRVYVAKTSVKTTPLDFAKRGTGDQDKIKAPRQRFQQNNAMSDDARLRAGLSAISKLEQNHEQSAILLEPLQQALKLLSDEAARHPEKYLEKYQAMLRLVEAVGLGKAPEKSDASAAATALATMIKSDAAFPAKGLDQTGNRLSKEYYKQLNAIPR